MEGAGQRQIPYLFKLKQSANVKKLIVKLLGKEQWVEAGQRWQGLDAELSLDLPEAMYRGVLYEYAVLVTSLTDEIRTIAQHYRDRGDSENNFDELKNQWGWAGFTTQDRKRCQVMARITALIYNWWNIFMRLAIPDQHAEAITSRPLALHGIARRTRHGNQTTIEVASTHSKAPLIAQALRRVSGVLKHVKEIAEQLTDASPWKLILSAAFQHFLCGKVLGGTGRLSPLPANCRF